MLLKIFLHASYTGDWILCCTSPGFVTSWSVFFSENGRRKMLWNPFRWRLPPLVCRLLKQTLMRVRWKAALLSTILWKSFMANGTSWSTASSLLPIETLQKRIYKSSQDGENWLFKRAYQRGSSGRCGWGSDTVGSRGWTTCWLASIYGWWAGRFEAVFRLCSS